MTITQTIDVPDTRLITLKVPREIPVGPTVIAFTPAKETMAVATDCPLCAKYCDPESGALRPNAETIAAIEEGRAMMRGEIPAKWYNSLEEMLADLDADD